MAANSSSLAPPTSTPVAPPTPPANGSQYPPSPSWEPPSFGRAAQVRVGATALLFVVAAGSNLALLGSVWRGRGRRRAAHLRPLVLSLAAADLLLTFLVMPLDAVWNVTVQWYAGSALCKLLSFLKLFAMHAAALVLVAISLDRQHAVLRPLDALHAHRRNRNMLLLAWGLSLLLASPQLFLFRTVRLDSADFTQCASHGSFSRHWQETAYNMFTFSTLYVLPLLVMSCCYSRILLHIHRQHLRNKAGESQLRRSGTDVIPRARLKTLRMAVVMVLSFVVCWTPYYLLGLWFWFQPAALRLTPEAVHHALFLFGNLSTCCDPLVYGLYTPSFRADLRACLRRGRGRGRGRDKNRAQNRDRDRERDRDRDKNWDRDRDRGRDLDRDRERDRDRDKNWDRDKNQGRDRDKNRDRDRTQNRAPNRAQNRSPNRAPVQHQDRSPDTVRSLDTTPDRAPDPNRDQDRHLDPNWSPNRASDLDRSPVQHPDPNRTPNRDQNRDRDRDRDQDQNRDRDRDRTPVQHTDQDRTLDRYLDQDRTLDRYLDQSPVTDQDRTLDRYLDQSPVTDQASDRSPNRDRDRTPVQHPEHSPDRYPDLEPTPEPGPGPRPGVATRPGLTPGPAPVPRPGLAPGPGLVSGSGLAPS